MLKDVLDFIWKRSADPTVLSEAANAMSPSQLREAAMIHVAALLGLEPTGVSGDKLMFEATSADVTKSADAKGDLEYRDISVAFWVKGIRIEKNDGPTTMGGLLDLFQYSRDHSDTLFYLPGDLRAKRIEEIATRCGASERFVRFVLSRFSSLQVEITA